MAKDQKKTPAVVPAPTTTPIDPAATVTPDGIQAAAPAEDHEGFVEIQEVILIKTGTGNSMTGTEEGKYSVVEVTLFAKPVAQNVLDSGLSYTAAKALARGERARRGGMERGL